MKRRLLTPFLLFLAVLPFVLAGGCRKSGDPVRQTLDEIAAAAGKTDDGAVLSRISETFRGPGGESKADLAAEVKRYFFAYESLDVTLSDVVIEKGPDRARAVFVAGLSGTAKKIGGLDGILPRTSKWKFEVTLVLEQEKWRIATGKWERLD
ncbi:MAG: hypothetical protein IT186_00250 [Acidobacteria bacterium]|nr:hypothetical protein [Acidobacteriota bacterium]